MKNVLVTGHTGFIGKETIKVLQQHGVNVVGVSRSIDPNIQCAQYAYDINDIQSLINVITSKCIDTIIHFAGKAIVKDCEINPYDAFQTNGLGTAAVLEAARISNITKVVSIETDKVYGIQENIPTQETTHLNPGTPYEFSKVLASNISDFYRCYYGMDIVSVRPVNTIGKGDHNLSRFLPNAIYHVVEGKGIPLYTHAIHMVRDFVHIKDVAKAIYILASKHNNHCAYNISSNKKITMLELANLINNTLNYDVPINYIEPKVKFKEIPIQSIDGSRFIEEYNFQYTPLEDAIFEMYQYFKNIKLNVL
jgi:nucleoside-diphosphate-sugar epimerase